MYSSTYFQITNVDNKMMISLMKHYEAWLSIFVLNTKSRHNIHI